MMLHLTTPVYLTTINLPSLAVWLLCKFMAGSSASDTSMFLQSLASSSCSLSVSLKSANFKRSLLLLMSSESYLFKYMYNKINIFFLPQRSSLNDHGQYKVSINVTPPIPPPPPPLPFLYPLLPSTPIL